MEKVLLGISDAFAEAPNRVLRYKAIVLLALVIITAAMIFAIFTKTSLDMSTDAYLDEADPAATALDEFRTQFGSDDSVFLVYRAKDGDVFSRQSLQAVQQLTDDLRNWQQLDRDDYPEELSGQELVWDELNHIRRIQSIANIRIQESIGDSLLSNRLVPSQLPATEAELAAIKTRALAHDDYLLAFYSADAQYGAIMIQTDFGAEPVEGYVPTVDSVDAVLDDSFTSFDSVDSFSLSFDETVEVQEVEYKAVDMLGYSNFATITRVLYEKYSEQFEFHPVGNPPLMDFMMNTMIELQILGLLMVLTFVLLLWILFRSFSAVLWPIATICLSVAWCWGITVWLGFTLTTMIALTALLVFAVGIADCVHVMSAYFSFRRSGENHYKSLSLSYEKTGLAILITTITTMAGMMALSFTGLEAIRVFGLMSAFGVFLAFFFTVLLLPILLDLWHPGAPDKEDASFADKLGMHWQAFSSNKKWLIAMAFVITTFLTLGLTAGLLVAIYVVVIAFLTYVVINWKDQILDYVPHIAARHPYLIVAIFATIFGFCAYGTSQVNIDTNLTDVFEENSPLRVTYEIVDENMAGAQSLEIMINTNEVDGLLNPEVLQAIDALQTRIESRYPNEITRTNSLANIVKDTNQIMNNGDPAYYKVPDSQQMISQLLYLFNSANPEDRRSLVSDDYSRSHITINAYNAGSHQIQSFFIELGEEIDRTFAELDATLPEIEVTVTGSMAMLMRMADQVANAQYSALLLAIAIITGIMILSLGSIQGALIAMIPNMIPALLAFGLMGLLGIPLDTDTLMIAPVIIGIAVDDTIHFMTHYRVELSRTGSISAALQSTIKDVGQAVMFTTMIIGLSFAVFSFSSLLNMAKIGFFGSAAIFIALLCDLFLIPALIIIFKPTFGVKGADKNINFNNPVHAA